MEHLTLNKKECLDTLYDLENHIGAQHCDGYLPFTCEDSRCGEKFASYRGILNHHRREHGDRLIGYHFRTGDGKQTSTYAAKMKLALLNEFPSLANYCVSIVKNI